MKNLDWNQIYLEGTQYAPVSEIVLDNLSLGGGLALDIGCGEGELMSQLRQRGYKTTGIDLAESAKPDIVGDFMTYDFGDIKFDLITVNLVLAFIKDKKTFVKKVKSLLNSDGRLIVITPILYKRYMKKYSSHYLSISVKWEDIVALFPKHIIHDENYDGGYRCRITLEPRL